MLIQRICRVERGYTEKPSASRKERPISRMMTSAMLPAIKWHTNFTILEPMRRPSRIASTIAAKLSSVKIRSAACLVTSLPFFPIAMPTSAAFREGASLTPSPGKEGGREGGRGRERGRGERRTNLFSRVSHVNTPFLPPSLRSYQSWPPPFPSCAARQ